MSDRRKRKMEEAIATKATLDMTPMIDVTFLLLIFFMCTIKFKTLEGKLAAYLPKDVGVNTTPAEPIEKIEIKLTVANEGTRYEAPRPNETASVPWKGEGRYVFGPDRRINYAVGPRTFSTVEEVRTRLRESFAATPERPITVDARKGTVYSDVVAVLDAAIESGFTQISFAGSYEK
jgi:biopolymer transport protein ExbD